LKFQQLKYKRAIHYPIFITILLIVISFTFGNYFSWYYVERKDATSQLNELLSNFISLLGIGLAILAVLFAIIQLAYKQLSIITLLIEESFFLPVFYFGMFNILLCSALASFQYSGKPFNDYTYIRMINTESYLFWLLIPALCLVFFKAVKLTNFSLITELYIKKVYGMAVKEKDQNTNIKFREELQSFGLEIREEINRLITENKSILLNKFFDFYLSVIRLNHNSNLLEDIHDSMQYWFIQSFKLADKAVFKNMITTWWRFYTDLLVKNSFQKTRFLSTLPLNMYTQYRKSKDPDIKFISIEIFPIRLKEIALSRLYKVIKERKHFNEELERIQNTISAFPELIKATIDEFDEESLEKLFVQIRLFIDTIELERQDIENKLRLEPHNYTADDGRLYEMLNTVLRQLESFYLTAYSWSVFKIDENE
jgi:hypothetical protein